MKTVVILTAILLLALQTQAELLRRTAHEIPAQEKPEAGDLDVVISFTGDRHPAQESSDVRSNTSCFCRTGFCRLGERYYGTCRYRGIIYSFCC